MPLPVPVAVTDVHGVGVEKVSFFCSLFQVAKVLDVPAWSFQDLECNLKPPL